jgi:poly(hydroxyalkanoate) depolymerase family esterase
LFSHNWQMRIAKLLLMSLMPIGAAAQDDRVTIGEHRSSLGTREFRLYTPAARKPGVRPPLLVMLHGCTQTAADVSRGTRLDAHAEAEGMLVLYPEQPQTANPQRCWNWFLPAHQIRDGGEPELLAGLIAEVIRSHDADTERVYVAGISAGAAMAVILAATYPELFAAAASHSGVAFGAARDMGSALAVMSGGAPVEAEAVGAARVPLMVIHGEADPVVSVANAELLASQWRRAGGQVELLTIAGLGHAWSGGSHDGSFTDPSGPDASGAIVRFLLRHRRAASE